MRIAVLGLGKVGLPLACALSRKGDVVGYDVDPERTALLLGGANPLPFESRLNVAKVTIEAKADSALADADLVFICVPTPIYREPLNIQHLDDQHVRHALAATLTFAKTEAIVVVVSTLDPRTVDCLTVDTRHPVIYNPPLIRLGRVIEDLWTQDPILIGRRPEDKGPGDIVDHLWQTPGVKRPSVHGSWAEIAMAKLAINATLSLRVAWANDIALRCQALGIDPAVVLKVVQADPRLGSGYMTPGDAPAGPCLPRDLDVWVSMAAPAVTLPEAVQRAHLLTREAVFERVLGWAKRTCPSRKLLILGMSYAPNTADRTEALGPYLVKQFHKLKWGIAGWDPTPSLVDGKLEDLIKWAEAIVIATEWPQFRQLDFGDKPVLQLDWRPQ